MNNQSWKRKVAYQIYPRSFCDANGDGIGDIKGITSKLDYLKELGIDYVWICPVYASPMDDGGYDISDYYAINPMFGTMEDMDELLREANKRNIKIIMDLVVNHCSDEHEWFKKALADPSCEEAEYFYFRNSEEGAPNNWRSMFGGSAWEHVGNGRYYMHLFSKKQPDLNWENPKLRERIYEMVNWWLDKGLGGWRIDAITHLKKEPTLSSLPPDGDDGMVGCFGPTRNYPGIGDFLTELRERTFDRYDCITVAEAAGVPYHQLGEYIGENGYFSTLFDFSYSELYSYGHTWYTCKKAWEWPISLLRDKMFASQLETEKIGFGAVYFENHDYPRASEKFLPREYQNEYTQKMLGTLWFYLRGIPFIYQGQELGMTNTTFDSIEDVDDISTKNHYSIAINDGLTPEEAIKAVNRYSRDNGRVPFPWTSGEWGGFSHVKPWMKVHPEYIRFNAEDEANDENSVLNYYKKMISLRKSEEYVETLSVGTIKPVLLDYNDIIAYQRIGNGKTVTVVCSFSPYPLDVKTEIEGKRLLISNLEEATLPESGVLKLAPFEAVVFES